MLGVAVHRTGRTLIGGEESDSLWIGLEAFLPIDSEMMRLTSAWLAWVELGRSQVWLESTVRELRLRERDALSRVHEHRLDEGGLDTLVAVLDGLRGAVCASRAAMSLERARELLAETSSSALERCAGRISSPDLSASGGGVVADPATPGERGDGEAEPRGYGGEHAEP
jgi:hypothetical protein